MTTLSKLTNRVKALGFSQILSLLFIFVIFLNILYQNLQYTSSFSIIPLRELDEFPFQKILMAMAGEIKRGEISYFFNNYQFGYGNSWWFLNTLFILPLKNFPSLHIFLPRFITQFFGLCSLILIFLRFRPYKWNRFFLILLIGSSFLFFRISTFFHNHSLLFFLSTLLFYLVTCESYSERKYFIFFIAGFGAGIKLTFIPVTLFFSVYMALKLFKDNLFKLKSSHISFILIPYGYFIGLSPLNALLYNIPQSLKLFKESLANSSSMGMYQNQNISLDEYFSALNQFSTSLYNIHLWIAGIIFIGLIGITIRHFIKNKPFNLLGVIALFVYLFVMYYLLSKGYSLWDVAMYLSSMVGVFLFSFYVVLKINNNFLHKGILTCLFILLINNIYCLITEDQHRFNYYTHQQRLIQDEKMIDFLSKAKPFLDKYPIKNIFYGFGIPHFFGGYSKVFYEDTLYGDGQVLQAKDCTLFLYQKNRVPSSDKLTPIYEDKIGGVGVFNCN